jgi:hypothetical protein
MGHAFWHPAHALDPRPGGWVLRRIEGTLGAIVRDDSGRFRCYAKRGTLAEHVGDSWTLAGAAVVLWNATHPIPWRNV